MFPAREISGKHHVSPPILVPCMARRSFFSLFSLESRLKVSYTFQQYSSVTRTVDPGIAGLRSRSRHHGAHPIPSLDQHSSGCAHSRQYRPLHTPGTQETGSRIPEQGQRAMRGNLASKSFARSAACRNKLTQLSRTALPCICKELELLGLPWRERMGRRSWRPT